MLKRDFLFFFSFFISLEISGQGVIPPPTLPDTLPVRIYRLPPPVNTPFSEYNPRLMPDSTFYFTSLRNEGGEDFDHFFELYWFMRLYRAPLTREGYGKPKALPPGINSTDYFTANYAVNLSQDRLFLTRCLTGKEQPLDCRIWETRKERGNWKRPEPLNRRLNLPGTTTTQPFLVEEADYAVLYFVSDRPGGFGGLDLWYSLWKEGRFADPVNLGSGINTPGDEITPFYDTTRHRLYFSSNGHPGIGGYDIFHSDGALSHWGKVDNRGIPFNSEGNDCYFSINPQGRSGYFSSTRSADPTHPEDTCCYDIFAYEWLEEMEPEEKRFPPPDTPAAGEWVRKLLPINLYFHNDEPDPRSWDSLTSANYPTALKEYRALKDLYVSKSSEGLTGDKRKETEEQMEAFFRDSVENGFAKLRRVTAYLLDELEKGNNVTLKISGYASALYQGEYNRRLTQRRICSFVNYLKEYGEGRFLPFLEEGCHPRLLILADPQGSQTAQGVADPADARDRANAVYSLSSALDRRITLTEIKTGK